MTLEMLMGGINVEGNVKVQCWENENNPTIYYEGHMYGGNIPVDLSEYAEREVAYIFPYTFWHGNVCIAGICIELAAKD